MMDFYGSQFSDEGLEAFFAVMRILALAIGVLSGIAFLKWRRAWMALVGLSLVVLIGWASSSYPLYRLYGLQYPGDRLRNLSWSATVAAGHSPFGTGTMGQTALEPIWPAVAGFLSMGRPEWTPHVFRFAPAIIMVGLALALYFHFSDRRTYLERDDDLNPCLRGLLVALFAVLLSTPPLDFLAPFRGYWAKMFLLKPNHALGLLMIPYLVALLSRSTWPRSAVAGLWLGLLGWVFIMHWGFVSAGLGVYLLVSALVKKRAFAIEVPKLVLTLMLGLLITLPYIYLIATYFPHAVTLAKGANPNFPTRSTWGDMLTTGTSLLFRVTFDQGIVFYFGLLGVVDWLRRRGRGGILWASMVLSAYLLWGVNALLYYTARAREGDEFYFFLVFVLSVAAGNGAYRLASIVSTMVKEMRSIGATAKKAVPFCVVLAFSALAFPYWWHPVKMDAHFRPSLQRLPRALTSTRAWILGETSPDDIFVSDSELGQWIPALTGRRLLYPRRDWKEKARSLITEMDHEPEWLEGTQTAYVVFDDSLSETLEIERDVLEGNPRFVKVHQVGDATFYQFRMTSQVE